MSPTISPGSTSNDTPSSATMPPKRTLRSRTARSGSLMGRAPAGPWRASSRSAARAGLEADGGALVDVRKHSLAVTRRNQEDRTIDAGRGERLERASVGLHAEDRDRDAAAARCLSTLTKLRDPRHQVGRAPASRGALGGGPFNVPGPRGGRAPPP